MKASILFLYRDLAPRLRKSPDPMRTELEEDEALIRRGVFHQLQDQGLWPSDELTADSITVDYRRYPKGEYLPDVERRTRLVLRLTLPRTDVLEQKRLGAEELLQLVLEFVLFPKDYLVRASLILE